MGQNEILFLLYMRYLENPEIYLTVQEIAKELNARDWTIQSQLNQLTLFKAVEKRIHVQWRMFSNGVRWRNDYRLRAESVPKIRKLLEYEEVMKCQNASIKA
jgi:hypothetical protein